MAVHVEHLKTTDGLTTNNRGNTPKKKDLTERDSSSNSSKHVHDIKAIRIKTASSRGP